MESAATGRVTAIRGPVIVTTEAARQRRLFVDALGHEVVAEEALSEAQVAALFGLAGRSARAVLYETPGTRIGAWVVELDPPDATVIRVGGVGYACDAMKMIDFFTADRPAAVARLKGAGFEFVSEGADVDLPDGGRFVEAHLRGPDGVMVAAIEPLNRPMDQFVGVTDRLFSEMQSTSAPVSDFEPVRAFYEDALGVPMGLRYEFESDSFSKMVGTSQTTRIRANNYGRVVEDVMLGIIHYGLPPGSFASLRERARPPHRGLVGVRLDVGGLDALLERCASHGVEIRVPPAAADSAALGRGRSAVAVAPHGVWHWLVEAEVRPRSAPESPVR
jgi:catechol 2,3-dioxygenase-like lactoylglutathione lyase family enzyme